MSADAAFSILPGAPVHRFLDEAGDTTFFGKGRVSIVGQPGVSLCFAIGMVKFGGDLTHVRGQVKALQAEVAGDKYLKAIPSIAKQVAGKGFVFHATDDPPEVRERFFKFLAGTECSCEVMVARKLPALFATKHHGKDAEFYADVLSHLLKNKLRLESKLVLNIAERGKSTRNANLDRALEKAVERHAKIHDTVEISSKVVFNVQNPHTEPLLNAADYLCWAVQRVFERGETRYYDFLGAKISLVVDLYDEERCKGNKNSYCREHRLTAANKIGPPSP